MLRVGCPSCGSADFSSRRIAMSAPPTVEHRCRSCGHTWTASYRQSDVTRAVVVGVFVAVAAGVAIKLLFF